MDDILSSRALLESAGNPKINYGGQSSSEALNGINENFRADLLALDADVAQVESDLATNKALLSCQSSAMGSAASRVSDLLADIKAYLIAGNGKVPVDMFDDRYKTSVNSASIDTTFGQATLEIAGQSDWLVAKDLEGNTWVPKESKVSYAIRTDATVPQPSEYKEDPEYVRALDGDPGTMWVLELSRIGETYANQHVWVQIQVPVDVIPNGYANTLIFRPFPVLCHDLVSAAIYSPGSTSGTNINTLSGTKLKYLPGYDSVSTYVKTVADTRLFFQPTHVTSIILHFVTGNFKYFGFSELSLKSTNFKATSTLQFDLAPMKPQGSTKNLSSVVLRGDNETYLGQIPPSIVGNKVTYSLTQQGSGYTPVITMLDTLWS